MLLNSGNKKFLTALSNCISDGIPSLARACLITVTWMSSSLSPLHGCNTFQPLACSILATKLVDSLSYDRVLEERVLASLSLLNLVRHPGMFLLVISNMFLKWNFLIFFSYSFTLSLGYNFQTWYSRYTVISVHKFYCYCDFFLKKNAFSGLL